MRAVNSPPPRRIGRFELGPIIGQGGAATVYEAQDTLLGVKRALKQVIAPNEDARQSLRRRLYAEAQAMARIGHPNILRVYDVLEAGDTDYVVMELCEGGSLSAWLDAHGPMPPDLAVRYAIQILSALSAAHAAGVVHRDVKPQNILLDRNGAALLADFGIALITSDDAVRTTRVGSAMGSLSYMPPEQRLDARSVGVRADIYAVGSTLYNLLTDRSPIDLFLEEPGSERWEGVPDALKPVLQRAVARDPAERFPDARAMATALLGALDEGEALRPYDPLRPESFPAPADALSAQGLPPGRGALTPRSVIEATNHAVTLMETGFGLLGDDGPPDALGATIFDEGLAPGEASTLGRARPVAPAPPVTPPATPPATPPVVSAPPKEPPAPRPSPLPATPRLVPVAVILALSAGAWWLGTRFAQTPPEVEPAPATLASTAPAAVAPPSAPAPEASPPEQAPPSPEPAAAARAPRASARSSTPPTAPEQAAPEQAALTPPLGTWTASFGGRPATLTLRGSPDALVGEIAVRLSAGATPVVTPVSGAFNAATRTITLSDGIEGPDAGDYTLTLEPSMERLSGRFVTRLGGRSLLVSGWRSP